MSRIQESLVLAFLVGIAGCGGAQQAVKPLPVEGALAKELVGAPEWVLMGCAAFAGEKGPICGVGSFTGTRNISLARDGAIARARTDLARNLEVKVKALYKDYQATTTGGESFGKAAADEQNVSNTAKQIVNTTLSGTTLAKTWMSGVGTLRVLVKLDVQNFKDQINQMKQLDEGVRQGVVQRADKAFKELDDATDFPAAQK